MILLIDNYDSFVFNLARYVALLGFEPCVFRNDAISLSELEKLNPSHIIISPGPCTPNEAGISLDVVKHFGKTIPILGVCLGHQVIGQAFGASIVKAHKPMHGKSSVITHDNKGIFEGMDNPIKVARYHSLMLDANTLPDALHCHAFDDVGEIMAVSHRDFPIVGLQFHPESVLTDSGLDLLRNFFRKIANTDRTTI